MSESNQPKFSATLENAMEPTAISANLCHRKKHKFVINIPPSQRRVLNERIISNFQIQVLMRIGLLCDKGTIWDKVPQGFRLHLNNDLIRHSKSPINLTPYIRPLMGRKLVADVSWSPRNKSTFLFTVVVLKMKNCNNFGQYMMRKINDKVPILDKESCFSCKDFLGTRDEDVEVTCEKVSLLCPLGIKRIQVAVQGKTCKHLQCFDAITYFLLNLRYPKWACPICLRPTYPQDLVINGLWEEMLRDSDSNLVSISYDGSWTPVNQKNGEYMSTA